MNIKYLWMTVVECLVEGCTTKLSGRYLLNLFLLGEVKIGGLSSTVKIFFFKSDLCGF